MHIALIAHDEKKDLMVGFATAYKHLLEPHQLYATGTTGLRIIEATGLTVHRFKSGPLGGDQQIGARISENKMDLVIFLRDSTHCAASQTRCDGAYSIMRCIRNSFSDKYWHSRNFNSWFRSWFPRLARLKTE